MKKICVSVLDWGLGHATRMMPIIRKLQQQQALVYIASSGDAASLLKQTFPTALHLPLPAYAIRYHRGRQQLLKVASQVPRLLRVIQAEQVAIRRYHADYEFDGLISDHRYGVYLDDIPSVMVAHQLALQVGAASAAVYAMHKRWLKPFDEIWIPDFPGSDNLAGSLAHTNPLPKNGTYIGPLSQFVGLPAAESNPAGPLLAIISGPEPQRTQLEAQVSDQLVALDRPATLLGGKLSEGAPAYRQQLHMMPFATGEELYRLISAASCVISRSGYSSLMDYVQLGIAKTILIPTPGQPEQEYLARYHAASGRAIHAVQQSLDLGSALAQASQGWKAAWEQVDFRSILLRWLSGI